MTARKPKPGPGGARVGAGRKPLGDTARSVMMTVKLTPDEVAAQQSAASAASSTWSSWARAALEFAVARGLPREQAEREQAERDQLSRSAVQWPTPTIPPPVYPAPPAGDRWVGHGGEIRCGDWLRPGSRRLCAGCSSPTSETGCGELLEAVRVRPPRDDE